MVGSGDEETHTEVEGTTSYTPLGSAMDAYEEFVPSTVLRPQAEDEAEKAEIEQAENSDSVSAFVSASPPDSDCTASPAAQAAAVARGVFAGRSKPARMRTLDAMFAMADLARRDEREANGRDSFPRPTARSDEDAPFLESPTVPPEEKALVAGELPVSQSQSLFGRQTLVPDCTVESLLSQHGLPLEGPDLPPMPRDKSPAAPLRPHPAPEKLLEVALQGPKNWLEGMKNGLHIQPPPNSAPSGLLCGPCTSCVNRGKPLQLSGPRPLDVPLIQNSQQMPPTSTTRNTDQMTLSVA